jgi:hypothetical protein
MQMSKKLYYFSELSDEAKEKARSWYNEVNDFPMLGSDLTNVIKEELEGQGFQVIGKYDDKGQLSGYSDLSILFSLSHSQGDGVSFEGTLNRDEITYSVTQSGHYVHEFTLDVTATDENGEELEVTEKALSDMRKACKETERYGYEKIEYEQSPENVDEIIEANEYTFTEDGQRLNPDKISSL